MPPDYSRILPFVIGAFAAFLIYMRLKRNFGAQPLRPLRMGLRVALLLLLASTLAPRALHSNADALAEVFGLGAGIAVALWSLSQTRFVMRDQRLHYVPHTYTGIAIASLVVGRVIYRFVEWHATGAGVEALGSPPASGFAPSMMVRSPVTVAIFFLLIGYYVVYCISILWKAKHLPSSQLVESI